MALLLLRFSSPPPARKRPGDALSRARRCMKSSGIVASALPLMADVSTRIPLSLNLNYTNLQVSKLVGLSFDEIDGMTNREENLTFSQSPRECFSLVMKNIIFLQKYFGSNFAKASAIAIPMVFALPPRVLAETCEADNSFVNMPLLFAIAMVGATVGGLLARQRKEELQRLNEQLRQINSALRRQAKIESYAPALSYAPVGSKIAESEVIVDPQKERLISYLRTGKNHLRNQAPDKAFPEFKAALDLAQSLGDHVEAKKAARGLGASLQRQGKYKEAIKYHSMVLDISKSTEEDSGMTEAYGAIADCYTELGELEKAGKYYDNYIARLENDE